MKFWEKIKKSVNKSLDNMAKENKKQFGDGVPDCCKMNRQNGGPERRQ